MKEIVILSGKGGTGKTSLMAAFAVLAGNQILCDADVDASDLHLIMAPLVLERHDFQAGHVALVNKAKCTACGLCRDLCRYGAIDEGFRIDPIDCEGCGVCVYFCPEKAIDFPLRTCGEWYVSETRFGPMVHARLGVAEENSGKLVTVVRQEARRIGEENHLDLIMTDGPPGVGCPVIASLGGVSAALIVTEPTVSGIHDMERVVQLAEFFRVPVMVCVNKADLNPDSSHAIETYVADKGLTFLGHIPFDPVFTRAMVQGQTIFEYDARTGTGEAIRRIWDQVCDRAGLQTSTKRGEKEVPVKG